ncbi:MAG: FAD-binding oxidoreductase [Gammaproteobacteria bacterium]
MSVESFWRRDATAAAAPLPGDLDVDFAVIGAGYCGLSTAIALRDHGASVAVIDAHAPGWGASGRNGGQVIPGFKVGLSALQNLFGAKRGESLFAFGQDSTIRVEALIARFGIVCHYEKKGWIRAAHNLRAARNLQLQAEEDSANGGVLEYVEGSALKSWLGDTPYVAGMIDKRGATINPYSYAMGLARGAAGLGIRIFGNTEALALQRASNRWSVHTSRGQITARAIGIATDGYTSRLLPSLDNRIIRVGSYQIATRILNEQERAVVIRTGVAASDTRALLRYFRLSPDGRLMVGGRGGFTNRIEASLFASIAATIPEIYPTLARIEIEHRWEGMVALTRDGLPRVMPVNKDVWYAGGFNGRGVAMASAFGPLLASAMMSEADSANPLVGSPLPVYPFYRWRLPVMALAAQYMKVRDAVGL